MNALSHNRRLDVAPGSPWPYGLNWESCEFDVPRTALCTVACTPPPPGCCEIERV